MCGIAGFICLTGQNDAGFRRFLPYFSLVLKRTGRRGPDAFGFVFGYSDDYPNVWRREVLFPDDEFRFQRAGEQLRNKLIDGTMNGLTSPDFLLANFRGVPTTEAGSRIYVQPYVVEGSYYVTHNGLISNDRQLYEKHQFRRQLDAEPHDIDSFVLGQMLRLNEGKQLRDSALRAFAPIEGSFAAAILSLNLARVVLARNFRGLSLAIWSWVDVEKATLVRYLVWASETAAFADEDRQENVVVVEMPGDSTLEVPLRADTINARLSDSALLRHFVSRCLTLDEGGSIHRRRSCAVVLSGGLDSTVCATWVCASGDYDEVHLLHFRYGARAEAQEMAAVASIQDRLAERFPKVTLVSETIDGSFIQNLGGSTLTDDRLAIARGELGVETAHEWVPARNVWMIGNAASYCDRFDIGTIVLGLNMEEGGVFCDNSIEFYQQMEKALWYGTRARPRLFMPLGNLMKHHIWKLGRDLEAPLDVSWSCYYGGDVRCGQCGPCIMRQRAAAMSGEDDPVDYVERDAESAMLINRYRKMPTSTSN